MIFDFVRLLLILSPLKKKMRKQRNLSCHGFGNEYNKKEIVIRVMQLWAEMKLVIARLYSD